MDVSDTVPRGGESVSLTFGRRVAWYVLLICLAAEIAFVALDYHVNYGRAVDIGPVRRMFNITREDSLASWFGTTQTFLVALTFGLLYAIARRRADSKGRALGWLVLAVFFGYMAIDDGAQIHERVGSALEAMLGGADRGLGVFPSYTWHIVLLPVFAVLGLFLLAFLWMELPGRASRALMLAAIACFVVAVGLDFVEGLDVEHRWNLYRRLSETYSLDGWARARFHESAFETLRHFSRSVEEALEMFATTLLWFVLLRHLPSAARELRIHFEDRFPTR